MSDKDSPSLLSWLRGPDLEQTQTGLQWVEQKVLGPSRPPREEACLPGDLGSMGPLGLRPWQPDLPCPGPSCRLTGVWPFSGVMDVTGAKGTLEIM